MNRIQEVIDKQGVTQAELARKLHKSKATVSLYTSNLVQPPIPVLFKIAGILHVDPRELIKVE